MHRTIFAVALEVLFRLHLLRARFSGAKALTYSDWRAACTAGGMLGCHFLVDRRTCPRLNRIALLAALIACAPVGSLAQNGTVAFFARVGEPGFQTVAAFTDAALLPVAGLTGKLTIRDQTGALVAHDSPAAAPGHALVALSSEPVQQFRICAWSGCRTVRVVRGDL